MQTVAIIVDSQTAQKPVRIERLLQDNFGGECHAMDGCWFIRTDESVDYVHRILIESDIFGQLGSFIVAPIAGKWREFRCASAVECFDEWE